MVDGEKGNTCGNEIIQIMWIKISAVAMILDYKELRDDRGNGYYRFD